ncbi:unnamed protein product [Polarella glacialis]|uniref:WWE domain-containing protein n=1 Tax=Polarella glacialis TaxID=89957 RepID=A0A813G8U5_POLGL|nr:unnamed protein product [Polarella glacialis]
MGCGASAGRYKLDASSDGPVQFAVHALTTPSGSSGEWRVEETPGVWVSLDPESGAQMLAAFYAGQGYAEYTYGGSSFLVDFSNCMQTNHQTGQQQRIGWVGLEAEKLALPAIWQDDIEPISAHVYLGGEWKVEESPGVWHTLGPEASAQFLVAWYCGDKELDYSTEDSSYKVDLTTWMQIDKQTGVEMRISWIRPDADGTDIATAEEQPLPGIGSQYSEEEDDSNGVQWLEPGEEEERHLLAALSSGQPLVRYTVNGCRYEVDVIRMMQTNVTTGEQWMVGVEDSDTPEPPYKTEEEGAGDEAAPSSRFAVDGQASKTGGSGSSDQATERKAGEAVPDVCAPPEPAETSAPSVHSSAPVAGPAATGRPRAYIYKADPSQPKPSKSKKYSLAPGQQPRLAGPKLRPAAKPPPQTKPPPAAKAVQQPEPEKPPSLPAGAEWPKDAKARQIAEAIFRDMGKSRMKPEVERRRAYLAVCLSWHPDKNPRHEKLATEVFQFLQLVKSWYFAAAA